MHFLEGFLKELSKISNPTFYSLFYFFFLSKSVVKNGVRVGGAMKKNKK